MSDKTKIIHYHGDITKLKIQCIVNASNESGLGCNIPNHCIDSAIHYAAGPKLLEECKKLNGIPTGIAKITNGYNLPAQYIIHITGPKNEGEPEDHGLLSQCYIRCLELAKLNSINQIAFCCLSTGIFGFNKYRAADTAISTIIGWLSVEPSYFDKIVFVTFTKEDYLIYKNRLQHIGQ